MGPRPNGRGKQSTSRRSAHTCLRQWGRGQTAAERRCILGMQAARAASMGPRPNGRGKSAASVRPLLRAMRQWGRGQTAAERLLIIEPANREDVASMGPRPNGRGKATYVAPSADATSRVNGAAAKRPRKGALPCRGAARRPQASMGPRPNGRGKVAAGGRGPLRAAASMGPRPNGRGKHVITAPSRGPQCASMGPRPNGRGKAMPKPKAPSIGSVNGAAAKRPRKDLAKHYGRQRLMRQWGRGQTAAESFQKGRKVI